MIPSQGEGLDLGIGQGYNTIYIVWYYVMSLSGGLIYRSHFSSHVIELCSWLDLVANSRCRYSTQRARAEEYLGNRRHKLKLPFAIVPIMTAFENVLGRQLLFGSISRVRELLVVEQS